MKTCNIIYTINVCDDKTGKATIEEAYDVAVANGHNPNKNIRWWSESI